MRNSSVVPFAAPRRGPGVPRAPDPLDAAVARALAELPDAPAGLEACVTYLTEPPRSLAASPFGVRALKRLRDQLFQAPGRSPEMRSLWRESIATASVAALVARTLGVAVPLVTAAGLLHRVGDAWALAVLAEAETRTGTRLLGAAINRGHLVGNSELSARLASRWSVGPEVLQAALGWRACLEEDSEEAGELTPARAVYLAHLFAVERLYGDYCTPGIMDAAAGELGVPPASIESIREQASGVDALLRAVD